MAKYPDLKSYLQANYIELFTSEIQKFVDGNYDGGGFHSINVLGYVVCINDPKYVMVDFSSDKAELKLSPYARKFANECCLKFSFQSTSYLKEIQDKYEFYGESYLSKEVILWYRCFVMVIPTLTVIIR